MIQIISCACAVMNCIPVYCYRKLADSSSLDKYGHPQKWNTDLPGYRIGIPIGIALRKQWTDIAIVISCSFYTIKSLNK